jgi:hypothetical protein
MTSGSRQIGVEKLTKLLKDSLALPQALIDFRELHDNSIE